MTESSASQANSLLVIGGESGAGLSLVHAAVRAGYTVVATNEKGTFGATRIRAAGAIPVSADITRRGELRSAMALAKATMVVNFAAERVLGLPQVKVDYETLAQVVEDASDALVAAAGKMGVTRLIHLSAAYLYGHTDHDPVTEEAPLERANALTKALARAEQAVFDGAIAGYVLRSGFVYGGWNDRCAALAEDLRQGRGVPQGHGTAAWIHEDDLAAAAFKLVQLEAEAEATANVLNIADNTPASHSAFMAKFGAAFGTGIPANLSGLRAQFQTSATQRELLELDTRINTDKIRTLLNWKPAYSQEAGLDRMTMIWRAEQAVSAAAPASGSGKELVKA